MFIKSLALFSGDIYLHLVNIATVTVVWAQVRSKGIHTNPHITIGLELLRTYQGTQCKKWCLTRPRGQGAHFLHISGWRKYNNVNVVCT